VMSTVTVSQNSTAWTSRSTYSRRARAPDGSEEPSTGPDACRSKSSGIP
jgi:hypothetical protein